MSRNSAAGSSPDVGSSRNMSRGRQSNSAPTLTRFRCPPESFPTGVPARSSMPEQAHRMPNEFADFRGRRSPRQPQAGAEEERLLDGKLQRHDIVLRNVTEFLPQRFVVGVQVGSVDHH